ncbi:hypothetical protein PHLCEN_2v1813 [Hermanssonia centrifuga]|uniref:Uncharacterized protein n=1 Tax=Hermanssonia centrifuga TaxID=98765 RepID=A0A2R6RVX6_9APHY|nr:hypothetical protein PHLCEN_2v1813 [Hermanssonia centrifuga]
MVRIPPCPIVHNEWTGIWYFKTILSSGVQVQKDENALVRLNTGIILEDLRCPRMGRVALRLQ